MRIGEAATRTGVSPRALRYDEERGLVISQRSSSGQRHYPEGVIARVRLIQLLFAAIIAASDAVTSGTNASGSANAGAAS